MAEALAVVTPVASTAQAKSRALGLDMANALAVVALLRLGGTGHWAVIRFVVCL
jgi:hypothetical protein